MNAEMNAIEAALELTKLIANSDPKRGTATDAKTYWLETYKQSYKTVIDAQNSY